MSQRLINVGTAPNAGNGDLLRNAMIKVNDNFAELFTTLGTTFDTAALALADEAAWPVGTLLGARDGADYEVVTSGGDFTTRGGVLLQDRKVAALSVSVGTGGDFPTINKALQYLSSLRRAYQANGVTAEIVLRPGFVMEEQVHIVQQNLGWVRIRAEDAEVGIARDALVAAPPVTNWRTGVYAAFLANRNAVLPLISAKFRMDTSGDGTGRVGILIKEGSIGVIERTYGILDAAWRGLYLDHGIAYARETVWDGGGKADGPSRAAAVRAANGSILNVRDSSATGAGCGLYVNESNVVAQDCDFSGAVAGGSNVDGFGLYAEACAIVYAEGTSFADAAVDGVQARGGARVNVVSAQIGNAGGSGINASEPGTEVHADGATITGCNRAVTAFDGARVWARGGNLSGAKTRAVSLSSGAELHAAGADITGACAVSDTNAVRLFGGARADLAGASISGGTGTNVTLEEGTGCAVNLGGATNGAGGAVNLGNIPYGTSVFGTVTGPFPHAGADIGDVSPTLTAQSPRVQRFDTPLTTSRGITLPSPLCAVPFKIIRGFGATDAGNAQRFVNVRYNSTTLFELGIPGTWVEMTPNADRTTWLVTGSGVLQAAGRATVADLGNTNTTLLWGSAPTQRCQVPITADRSVTLPAPTCGGRFRIVRTAEATGAFSLDVHAPGAVLVAQLAAGQWVDVDGTPDLSGWFVSARGSL